MHGELFLQLSFCSKMGQTLQQSNASHACPSRPLAALSHFIYFEPLIVPVSMLLPRCRLALDETF
jgi:hypothetical protein